MKREPTLFRRPPLALACSGCRRQTSRTPWGDPDLQGTWSNATLTPLQRPADLDDKEFFTPEEAQGVRAAARRGHERRRAHRRRPGHRQRRLLQRRVDGPRQRHRPDAAHLADRRARERPRSAVHGRSAARARAQSRLCQGAPGRHARRSLLDGAVHRLRRRRTRRCCPSPTTTTTTSSKRRTT